MELLEGRIRVEDVDDLVETLTAIGDEHGCTIQAFDARYIAGRPHLGRAVELADRSIDRGENVARDRAVEILLYAAGRRQINQALEMGLDPGENDAVVLVDAEVATDDEAAAVDALRDALDFSPRPTLGVEHADDALVCEFFSITDTERAATDADLTALVCERVALLDVEK